MSTVALPGKVLPTREVANWAATLAPSLKLFALREGVPEPTGTSIALGSRYTSSLNVTPWATSVPPLPLSLTCSPSLLMLFPLAMVRVPPPRTKRPS